MFTELKKVIDNVNIDTDTLYKAAKEILLKNNLQSSHSNWGAAFTALGFAYFDTKKAESLLRNIFDTQLDNGMLPLSTSNESGKINITLPPIHGFILWQIYQKSKDKESTLSFLKEMYPKILANHKYLYENRDPSNEGLIYIRHPWESSTDNSPVFDSILNSNNDTTLQELEALFEVHKNDETSIFGECSFLIQDPFFNSILCKSNECMIKIASLLKEDVTDFVAWNELTIYSMNEKLWDDNRGIYDSFDLKNNCKIPNETLTGLLPLFGRVPTQEQAEKILLVLESKKYKGTKDNPLYLFNTYNSTANDFETAITYRGAISIVLSTLLYHGMENYSFYKLAGKLRKDTLHLLATNGYSPFFDPRKSIAENKAGHGGVDDKPVAALSIDLLHS